MPLKKHSHVYSQATISINKRFQEDMQNQLISWHTALVVLSHSDILTVKMILDHIFSNSMDGFSATKLFKLICYFMPYHSRNIVYVRFVTTNWG